MVHISSNHPSLILCAWVLSWAEYKHGFSQVSLIQAAITACCALPLFSVLPVLQLFHSLPARCTDNELSQIGVAMWLCSSCLKQIKNKKDGLAFCSVWLNIFLRLWMFDYLLLRHLIQSILSLSLCLSVSLPLPFTYYSLYMDKFVIVVS